MQPQEGVAFGANYPFLCNTHLIEHQVINGVPYKYCLWCYRRWFAAEDAPKE